MPQYPYEVYYENSIVLTCNRIQVGSVYHAVSQEVMDSFYDEIRSRTARMAANFDLQRQLPDSWFLNYYWKLGNTNQCVVKLSLSGAASRYVPENFGLRNPDPIKVTAYLQSSGVARREVTLYSGWYIDPTIQHDSCYPNYFQNGPNYEGDEAAYSVSQPLSRNILSATVGCIQLYGSNIISKAKSTGLYQLRRLCGNLQIANRVDLVDQIAPRN